MINPYLTYGNIIWAATSEKSFQSLSGGGVSVVNSEPFVRNVAGSNPTLAAM